MFFPIILQRSCASPGPSKPNPDLPPGIWGRETSLFPISLRLLLLPGLIIPSPLNSSKLCPYQNTELSRSEFQTAPAGMMRCCPSVRSRTVVEGSEARQTGPVMPVFFPFSTSRSSTKSLLTHPSVPSKSSEIESQLLLRSIRVNSSPNNNCEIITEVLPGSNLMGIYAWKVVPLVMF